MARPARWLALGAVAYLGVLAVNRALVEVRGPSMEPLLWEGDRLLTVPAWRGAIRPGRIVVVRDPADPAHLVVKRVHAVDGEVVDVRGDAADHSTDSRSWGPLPIAPGTGAVRRLVVARWPDLRTPLVRHAGAHQPANAGHDADVEQATSTSQTERISHAPSSSQGPQASRVERTSPADRARQADGGSTRS